MQAGGCRGAAGRPVCVRACRCSSSLRVNLFPQKNQLQTKGRSPVCRRTWARSKDVFRKVLPQSGIWHTCFFLPCSPDLGIGWRGGDGGNGKPRKGGGRRWRQDRMERGCEVKSEGTGRVRRTSPLHLCPREGLGDTGHVAVWWSGPPLPLRYLLSPSLQLGHVQAMRRRFSPGWASPASACSICSWICVGLSPLMVRLFPDTFCTVSCCCPVGRWGGGHS